MSCHVGGDMMVVRMGGSIDVDRIGESDTKKDADVVTNDANTRHTGVYVELSDAAVVSMASDDSSVSCRFCFHVL